MADAAEHLGGLEDAVEHALEELRERDAVRRVWERDHTLWREDPTEITDRLGWLDCAAEASRLTEGLTGMAADVAASGATGVTVVGMGGSSLFADVVGRSFPEAGMPVRVLDSTDPAAVRRAERRGEGEVFVVASKSGTTVETRSHLAYLWDTTGHDPDRFMVVTDPDSPLGDLGREHDMRRVFENRPDIGGRYSALSLFGLVPAALSGVDLDGLLERAATMAGRCAAGVTSRENPAARLAAVMAAGVRRGRDKLTLLLPEEIEVFGDWIEQLVAESLGKDGTGVIPVTREPTPDDPDAYGDDRLFVSFGPLPSADQLVAAGHPVVELPFGEEVDIGAEVFRWEMATALAGALLAVHPFDQPDVAAAKQATAEVLARGLSETTPEPMDPVLDEVEPGDYLAVLAYVDPGAPVVTSLRQVTGDLRDELGVPVTLGIGPRYLHSTGQLHKGGPETGLFLQVVSDDDEELQIPGEPHGFSTLKRAQAAGDLQALRDGGLRAARIELGELLGW